MKMLRIVLALVVSFGLVACVSAGDADKKADKKAAKKGTAGLVEKVDGAGKTFTMKTGKKKDPNATELSLTVTDQTKFLIQGADGVKDGKFGDLLAGKRVMVKKETKDGKEVATEVVVVERKKKKNG